MTRSKRKIADSPSFSRQIGLKLFSAETIAKTVDAKINNFL
jgi:hypothetical protein